MVADSGVDLTELKVDGGMTANSLLMQFQADLLDVVVVRPEITETTALGAAYAAGLALGFWDSMDELRALWSEDERWESTMDATTRDHLVARWKAAIQRSLDWT
jgi:glycerol kinase